MLTLIPGLGAAGMVMGPYKHEGLRVNCDCHSYCIKSFGIIESVGKKKRRTTNKTITSHSKYFGNKLKFRLEKKKTEEEGLSSARYSGGRDGKTTCARQGRSRPP